MRSARCRVFGTGPNRPVQSILNDTKDEPGWFWHGKQNTKQGRQKESKRKREEGRENADATTGGQTDLHSCTQVHE